MADIKIRIQADSSSAIKEMEKLSSSSDYTAKSLTKLSNEMARATTPGAASDVAELTKLQNQYLNAVDRTAKSYELSGTAVAAYKKQIALLSREYQKMAAIAPGSGVTSALGSRVGNAQANLSETLKEEARMQEEAAAAAGKHTKAIDKQNASMKTLIASYISANAILGIVSRMISRFVDILKDSAEAAAEAEETANLFNVTFENIGNTASRTASEIASSLGIATSSAQEALGMFGSLAQGYGETQAASIEFAEEAVRTTLDLISFRNITGDVNTIMSEFSSGLVGNYENFRKWGIVITANEVNARLMAKGLSGLTGEALQFAKIQETLNIVQERSANAMGDMERTLDSTANVQRRVTEANKELMENMGNSINRVLTPLRSMWLDIVDSINKANRAQEEFAAGSKDINVYDIRNNKGDWHDFELEALKLYSNVNNRSIKSEEGYESFKDEAYELMLTFGASAEDVFAAFGKDTDELNAKFVEGIKEVDSLIESERESQKALEDRRKRLESSISEAQRFFDSLSGISGVSITQSASAIVPDVESGARSELSLSIWTKELEIETNEAIEEAISSIDASSWDKFVSPIELAIGEADIADGLEAKANAIRQLYETVYNQHLKDGELTEKELSDLETIVEAYKGISEELSAITSEKERQSELETAIAEMASESSSYDRKLSDISAKASISAAMPKVPQNIIDNELSRQSSLADIGELRSAALALAKTDSEIAEVNESFDALIEKANSYYDSARTELEKENLADAAIAFKEAVSSVGMLGSSYPYPVFSSNQNAQSLGEGMYDELLDIIDEMMETMKASGATEELIASQVTAIQTIGMDKIAEAVEKQEQRDNQQVNGYDNAGEAILSSLGEMGMLVTAFQNITASAGGLIGILINLVAQTELVQRVCSFLSDTILPVLNAFLEPLMPVLDMLTILFQNLIQGVLAPAFPVLKMIASALALVFGLLNIVVGFVTDSVKFVVGWIIKSVYWLINGIIDILNWIPFVNIKRLDDSKWAAWANTDVIGNVEDNWNTMQDTLDEIAGLNMEIAENTSESPDLSVYNEMLSKGLINASEYAAMVSNVLGRNYDNVLTYGDGAYWNGAGGSTNISNDNISIVINGDNLDSKEIAQEVLRALNEKQRGGGALYA